MFSLENFYYILYTNLFKPARIRVRYFLPFGSVAPSTLYDLVTTESAKSEKHHIIMYDQEPLLEKNVENLMHHWEIKTGCKSAHILCNSEISETKQKLCRAFNHIDFYYFFHGFAALDWYRDYKYINENYPISKKFIVLNHLVTNDRSYRLFLVSKLTEKNILSEGTVSLHATTESVNNEITCPETKLSRDAIKHIQQYLLSSNLPIIADTANPYGSLSAAVGPNEHMMHQKALWHIVPETVFYYSKLHLTEKIFRPIVNKRPFILLGAPGNLAYLKRYGFKTFDQWIDESYDDEENNDRRTEMVVNQIEKISKLSMDELRNMQKEMNEVLEFNFQHFYGNFKSIIYDELVENFKSAVAQWNHGRLDRKIDLSQVDFEKARNLLLS